MKIMEIKFELKVNLGNYEHEMLSISGSPEEGEDCDACIKILKEKVYGQLGKSKPKENQSELPGACCGAGKSETDRIESEPVEGERKSRDAGDLPTQKRRSKKCKNEEVASEEDIRRGNISVEVIVEDAPVIPETTEATPILVVFNREIPEHKKIFQKALEKELEKTFGPTYGKDKKALDTVRPTVQFMLGKNFIHPEKSNEVLPAFIEEMGACIKRLSEVKSA